MDSWVLIQIADCWVRLLLRPTCSPCLSIFALLIAKPSYRILVLKDGQIVEQGSHTDLLARGGVFASMWADQISTSGDVQTLAEASNPLPEAEIVGYSAQLDPPEESQEVVEEPVEQQAIDNEGTKDEPVFGSEVSPAADPAVEPEVKNDEEATPPVQVEPPAETVAFPSSEPAVAFPSSPLAAEPASFPVSPETEDVPTETTVAQSPAVTFDPGLTSPTTPSSDADSEPKRKRISSQNFQRLARRISITTRRQGSTSSIAGIIPGLKRDKTASGDDNSVRDSIDSPTGSISGDKDKGKSKKEKKDKRKSTSGANATTPKG